MTVCSGPLSVARFWGVPKLDAVIPEPFPANVGMNGMLALAVRPLTVTVMGA